jgi:hypothetical protein
VLETDQDAKFAYSSEPLIEEPVCWVNAAVALIFSRYDTC